MVCQVYGTKAQLQLSGGVLIITDNRCEFYDFNIRMILRESWYVRKLKVDVVNISAVRIEIHTGHSN